MVISPNNIQQLRRHAAELTEQVKRLNEAADILSGFTKSPTRRVLSIAARKRIAQAQKIRWAKWKAKRAA